MPVINVICSGYLADRIVAANASRYRYLPEPLRAMKEPVMLRRSAIAIVTVAAFAVSSISANVSATTHGGGQSQGLSRPFFNGHSFRFNHRAHLPYGAFGYLPYGGFTGADMSAYYTPDSYGYFTDPIALFSMLRQFDHAMPMPAPISCKHSVEAKTVPSEEGGEQNITITRC